MKSSIFTQTTGIGYFSYTFVGSLFQLHCEFRFNGASTLTYQDGTWARSCSLSLRSCNLINHEGRLPFFQGLIEIYFFTVICWWAVKPWNLQLIWGSLLTHLPGFSLTKKRESDEERIKSRLLTRFKLWNFWVSLEIIWNLNSNVGLFW